MLDNTSNPESQPSFIRVISFGFQCKELEDIKLGDHSEEEAKVLIRERLSQIFNEWISNDNKSK